MGMAMGDHPQESLEITINIMGTLLGVHPSVPVTVGKSRLYCQMSIKNDYAVSLYMVGWIEFCMKAFIYQTLLN